MSYHDKTTDAAKGKWRGVLLALGVPEPALKNKHGPCPMCGGTDRFRWDNQDGRGTFICSSCGSGDGMKFAIDFTGQTFAQVAAKIDGLIGNLKPDADKPRAAMSDDQCRMALRSVYAETAQVQVGDLADKYLTARGVGELIYPKALRFGERLKDGDGGVRPCMVAMVTDADGKPVTLHRTFLRPDGLAKAEMPAPRKMMPGTVPEGSAVRFSDYVGGPLGIAEGIETALSASALHKVQCWSAINANLLAKWQPPAGCEEVVIFGDNDPKFAGQAAAYRLAYRLACQGVNVTIQIPPTVGTDWADVLMSRKRT